MGQKWSEVFGETYQRKNGREWAMVQSVQMGSLKTANVGKTKILVSFL